MSPGENNRTKAKLFRLGNRSENQKLRVRPWTLISKFPGQFIYSPIVHAVQHSRREIGDERNVGSAFPVDQQESSNIYAKAKVPGELLELRWNTEGWAPHLLDGILARTFS